MMKKKIILTYMCDICKSEYKPNDCDWVEVKRQRKDHAGEHTDRYDDICLKCSVLILKAIKTREGE